MTGATMRRFRIGLLLLLVGGMAPLMPLAYASPPDPSWIAGLYDEADFDNVVLLVTTTVAAVDPFPLDRASAVPLVISLLRESDEGPRANARGSAVQARAPPAF